MMCLQLPSCFSLPVAVVFLLSAVHSCNALASINTPANGRSLKQPESNNINENEWKQTANNLLAICSHLQNPQLYNNKEWSDAVAPCNENGLVASRDIIESGEILSLFPVHAIGLQGLSGASDTKPTNDYIVFDDDLDGDYFRASKRSIYQETKITCAYFQNKLMVDVNPNRSAADATVVDAGWMAHLAATNDDYANCRLVPILAAAPLLALVSTCPIPKGSILCQSTTASNESSDGWTKKVEKRYKTEISELASYLQMAYPPSISDDAEQPLAVDAVPEFQHAFREINREYPGMVTLRTDPDILEIDGFLTEDECDRLIAKAKPHLIPCVTKDPVTGTVQQDLDRTSLNANIPQREVPTVVKKIQSLIGGETSDATLTPQQLEIFQVLHYKKGERFATHTDGFDGPTTACGFTDSGRIVTIFVYLNNVANGGETRFPELGLDVVPKKGKAVLHFPATVGFEEDLRVEHEGVVAVDDKWLLVTWVWKDERSDDRYAEDKLPSLSEDIV